MTVIISSSSSSRRDLVAEESSVFLVAAGEAKTEDADDEDDDELQLSATSRSKSLVSGSLEVSGCLLSAILPTKTEQLGTGWFADVVLVI